MSEIFDANILKSDKLHDFSNWVAIVTGGGTGLGYITAAALVVNGASRVYITGRRPNILKEAVSKFESDTGLLGRIIPYQCDVTSKDQVLKFASYLSTKEQCVNLLVNNAGIGGVKNRAVRLPPETSPEEFSEALLECTEQTWDDVMHINTSAVYYMTAALLPLLVQARKLFPTSGSVLNVSSMSGITKQSQGGQFPYNSAKAAMISLTQLMAYEFRRPDIGIRVNTVAPGYFSSEMTPKSLFTGTPEEIYKERGIPLGRQGGPKDYAQAILYFASNEYSNGSTLVIDGGWLLEQS